MNKIHILIFILLSIFTSIFITKYLDNKYEQYSFKQKDYICILLIAVVFSIYLLYKIVKLESSGIWLISTIFSIVSGILASSCMVDIRFRELPDENSIIVGILMIVYSLIRGEYLVIISAILLFIIFFAISVLTNQFGMGDTKMMSLMGLGLLPNEILQFVFKSFLMASIYIVFKLVLSKDKEDKTIAFGPFLIMGFLMVLM